MNIAHRKVPLNGTGHRLEFDYNAGLYRVAFYFPRRDAISGKQTGEHRLAIKHTRLIDALGILFAEAEGEYQEKTHDPLTVERWMRSQPWGKELPE
jgi:hypothetical protein